MNNPSLPIATRELLNGTYRIGVALNRKFDASDMTPALRQAAVQYAATYQLRPEGDDFMRDMQDRVSMPGFLSDGQAKGVLNVMMADARRRLAGRALNRSFESAPPTVAAPAVFANVPDGRYRVTLPDGDHLAIRINLAKPDSKLRGSRFISTRTGSDEWSTFADVMPDGTLRLWRSAQGALRGRIQDAVKVLDTAEGQDGWLVAGLAFAQAGSQCFICGRDLDTPESLTAGYGPICADKLGLPWGAKAVPMSVKLAQAEVAPATPAAPSIDPVYEAAVADLTPGKEIQTASEFADWTQTMIARAQAEGRSRTYAEIFGEDSD